MTETRYWYNENGAFYDDISLIDGEAFQGGVGIGTEETFRSRWTPIPSLEELRALRASTIPALISEAARINVANGWREPGDPGATLLTALATGYLVEMTERVEAARKGKIYEEAEALAKARVVCAQIERLSPEQRQAVAGTVLIATEAMEAIEAVITPGPSEHCPQISARAEELADIVIRTMDCAGIEGIDLAEAVKLKLAYNATRGYRHGGKRV